MFKKKKSSMKWKKIKTDPARFKTDGVQAMGIFGGCEYKDYSMYYLLLPSVIIGDHSRENHQNMHAT